MHIVSGPLPAFSENDVLIQVEFAGVNRPDVAQRSGSYAPPPGASPIMGLEVSGTIVAIGGGVTSWKIGDAVCTLTPGGGYAQYCAAPAEHCLPVPKGLSM
ncbi:MAG: alcohol dehydrogenase catalytic domain-containing protein, partial [Burkholderiales bacterium]|nr:alcohol dehydrogenase catalytic domain-containing protein [Burkholderiales bacterium]